ncbi:mechanosensitive ion channel family protein [Bacillus tianshenii]|nr:mechanosensitive ion channel family protein [Bacillus tianshenii]
MNALTNMWTWFVRYLTNEERWQLVGKAVLEILLIWLVAFVLIRIGKKTVQKLFELRERGPVQITQRRKTTLLKLLTNVLTYCVYFIAIVMTLEAVSIDIKAILAGAGIVGLAVGFGAQNLVRDIISGFFIIFEDQFSVGDFIRVGKFEGFVEEIGLRTTKIKSWTGEMNILPNGNINEVTNFSLHNSVAVVDVSIAYEGNIVEAEAALEELLKELPGKYEDMVSTPELLGVQSLGASEVIMRVISEVKPMAHWHIGRVLRKEIKLRLDERGIEIPFPRLVMYNRSDDEEKMSVKENA